MKRLFYGTEGDDIRLLRESVASAFAASPGGLTASALSELGWIEFAEQSLTSAVAILFHEQGRSLGASDALNCAAFICLAGDDKTAGTSAAVATRLSSGRDGSARWLARTDAADAAQQFVLVDPEHVLVEPRESCSVVRVETVDPTSTSYLVRRSAPDRNRPCSPHVSARIRAVAFLSFAHELLGVCDRVLEMSVLHAQQRHQFGRPIGSFQAVQLLLADAALDLAAAQEVLTGLPPNVLDADMGVGLDIDAGLGLAVRAATTCTNSAQQVFGAIGYTAEHPLHRYIKRSLVLSELADPACIAQRLGAAASTVATAGLASWINPLSPGAEMSP